MNPVTWTAIYLMIWWVTFFTILPLWNVTHPEAGTEAQKGNDPGAPITHNLWKKVKLNTVVATVVWLILFLVMKFGHVPLPVIPGQ